MWAQSSFKGIATTGILYIVPTPIGNLEDMTVRAVKILQEVDLIAAEDTRVTRKLCNYFNIDTPVSSYHEHNKIISGNKLISMLQEGKNIAIVSDAGTPGISDPGYEIVRDAVNEQIHVVSLPGCNAAITALSASGLPTDNFIFFGFLSRNKKDKRIELDSLKTAKQTIILYESPHRLKETLSLMHEIFGNRRVTLARELTKIYEEYIRGTISEAIEYLAKESIKGEFCLIIEGNTSEEPHEEYWWEPLTVIDHVKHYQDKEQLSNKDAIKKVAMDRDIPKREVYSEYHGL
jgi:16S rRNA (cytidine1402-2'-O)-methyltransferase